METIVPPKEARPSSGEQPPSAGEQDETLRPQDETLRPGTTKRRQYYYKRIAPCLIKQRPEPEPDPSLCRLCGAAPPQGSCPRGDGSDELCTLSNRLQDDCRLGVDPSSSDGNECQNEVSSPTTTSDHDTTTSDGSLAASEADIRTRFPNVKYYHTEEDPVLR